MDQRRATQLTANIAELQWRNWRIPACPELSYEHIQEMNDKIQDPESEMSDTKIGRWLGWMQAAVVAQTYPYTSLETMKNLNKECAQ